MRCSYDVLTYFTQAIGRKTKQPESQSESQPESHFKQTIIFQEFLRV